MSDKKQEVKELTVDDLEDVAGGRAPGIEVGETSGGTKNVRIDAQGK